MRVLTVMSGMYLAACATSTEGEIQQYEGAATSLPAVCDYPQAFGTSTHTGIACPEQHGLRVVATVVQDPDADAENAAGGFLQIHEGAPLTSGDWVVVPSKSGFKNRFDRRPEVWALQALRWNPSVSAPGATLVPVWSTPSTWKPVDAVIDAFTYTSLYVQGFYPLIANNSVYMPAVHGQVDRVNLNTGEVIATIDPLAGTAFSGDRFTLTVNALSADRAGNVYYAVVAFPIPFANKGVPPRGSWLVKVRPDNSTQIAAWETGIATPAVGIPGRNDLCEYPFGTGGTPFATGPNSRAPQFPCGPQRPSFNAPLAISEDGGTLVAYTAANNAQGAAFLVQIDALTLQPLRASDTRGHLLHGCGVRLSLSRHDCDVITAHGTVNIGNDPDFNGPPRLRGPDIMDNAPTIAPDGSMTIGGYDGGFSFGGDYDARGASFAFRRDGSFLAKNEEFAWEVTPSVLTHADGTYSYLQDRQLYSDVFDGDDTALSVASYSPSFALESIGTIPLSLEPAAIDFLDANILFDVDGARYGVNGDGHVYKFGASGKLLESVALLNADGSIRSMETESGYGARDRAGRLYFSYAGHVYVIAGIGVDVPVPTIEAPSEPSATLKAGIAAKRASVARVPMPSPPAAIATALDASKFKLDDHALVQPNQEPSLQCDPLALCAPVSCWTDATGVVWCNDNGFANLACEGLCGSNSYCPILSRGRDSSNAQFECRLRCGPDTACSAACAAQMNQTRLQCQTGREP